MKIKTQLLIFLVAASFSLTAFPGSANPVQSELPPAAIEVVKAVFENPVLDYEAFDEAICQVASLGASSQQILELKIIYALDHRDVQFLEALALELSQFAETTTVEPSNAIWLDDHADLLGAIALMEALAAQGRGDELTFEAKLKESFWLAPRSARFYGALLADLREKARVANLRLPMDSMVTAADGTSTTLREVLSEGPALVLNFWAEWCGACLSSLPHTISRASMAAEQGIVFVGINVDGDAESANRIQEQFDVTFRWLLDSAESSLAQLLNVKGIPHAVIVDGEGRILFEGHPASDDFAAALDAAAKAPVESPVKSNEMAKL